MKNTLEGSKFFPYVAWSSVILFALFTYSLVSGIQKSTAYLAERTEENKAAIETLVQIKKLQNQKAAVTTDRR